jgi:hypothetical protein
MVRRPNLCKRFSLRERRWNHVGSVRAAGLYPSQKSRERQPAGSGRCGCRRRTVSSCQRPPPRVFDARTKPGAAGLPPRIIVPRGSSCWRCYPRKAAGSRAKLEQSCVDLAHDRGSSAARSLTGSCWQSKLEHASVASAWEGWADDDLQMVNVGSWCGHRAWPVSAICSGYP